MVIAMQSDFYNFYASTMRTWCPDGSTTKSDYDAMSKAICERHKELINLKHPVRPHGTVSRHLSVHVRNQRQNEKKAIKKHLGEEQVPAIPAKQSKTEKILNIIPTINNDIVTKAEEDILNKNLEELKRMAHVGANPHVKRLVKETFEYRKKKLNEMDSIKASIVLEAFPFLKNVDLILLETCLRNKTTVADMETKLRCCIDSLTRFYNIPCTSECSLLSVTENLYKDLKPKKLSKLAADVFISREARQPQISTDLKTVPEDAPRLIMYFDGAEGTMCSAFVVADGTVEIQIENPSVIKCFLTLMATYHAWNIGYGPTAKNILSFLDEEVLGIKTKNLNSKFRDFQVK